MDTSHASNLQEKLSTGTKAAIQYADARKGQTEKRLFDLLRIPSISTQPEHEQDCRNAARFLCDELASAGLEHTQVLETGGLPCVYGDWLHASSEAPTVLVYGHYDVQPPDPLDEWNTPAFEPTVVDGNVVARGASDDKGQLWVHVEGLRAILATEGMLPVNVKVIFEGEEESGSEHLDEFVKRERERLACDVVLVSDTHMLSADRPSIVASLRGMSYCEISVFGPQVDLHSGIFGGAVRNPAEALTQILASCKDDSGHITIPGFYDDVIKPSRAERESFSRIGYGDEQLRTEAGITTPWGEEGWTSYERIGVRPTFEINGLWSGYTGAGAKTVLPASAHAKVSMRLVANQDWQQVTRLLESHVRLVAQDIPGVEQVTVKSLHGGSPVLIDTDHPAINAARQAILFAFGHEPVFTREGGSIPVVATFASVLEAPTVLMGFGLPDDRLHSPNEKFTLSQLHKGVKASIAFWSAYADAS